MTEFRVERGRIRARNLRRLLREPTEVLLELAAGRDLVSLRLGPRRVFVVNHPELVEQVLARDLSQLRRGGSSQAYRLAGVSLVGCEGEEHARRRALVMPLFAGESLARCGSVVTDRAAELERVWSDGGTRDIDADMTDQMIDVIGAALFGSDYRSHAVAVRTAFDASRKVIHRELLPLSVVLWTLPLPATRRYRNARSALKAVIVEMAARRRADGDRSDMLGLMACAADGDGRGLTDDEIADETWGFLAQGAPAHVLSWCWWLLAAHPEWERRVHDELERALAGRTPNADDMASLTVTRAIVLEAMRIYPPVWGVDRVPLQDYRLAGEAMPGGSTVFMSAYVTQRDERFWPDPTVFDPDRWLSASGPSIDDHTYLTFGAGQRLCVARRFVLLHCILTLATLAQRWQLRPVSDRLQIGVFPFLRPVGLGMLTTRRRES